MAMDNLTPFRVPLDYQNSTAGVAKIALSRHKAKKSPNKGTILYNPGGPGGSGKRAIIQYGSPLQAAIAEDYDWVGFDPRGIGETEPQVHCFPDGGYRAFQSHTVLDQGYDIPPNLNDPQTRKALILQQHQADALFKAQFELCKKNMGETLRYMGTTSVVRDIDFITTTLDGKDALINYYGVSYGSLIGSYLVNMFPDRIGRVVLDGIVNPILWSSEPAYKWYRSWSEDSEAAYKLFLSECSSIGPEICPLANAKGENIENIEQRIQNFLDTLYNEPIPTAEATPPGILTSGRALIRIYLGLQHPLTWKELANALHTAIQEKNTTLLMNLGKDPTAAEKEGPPDDLQRSAVSCNDNAPFDPPTAAEVVDENLDVVKHVSRFAFSIMATEQDTGCQFWPVTPPERFEGPWNHKLRNPILIHSNKLDPITPIASGRLINTLLQGSSVLVAREGPGHCSFSVPSLSSVKISQQYFKDGVLPSAGQECPIDISLFTNTLTRSLSREDKELMKKVNTISLYFNHIL
ncbi:hypothetical protein M422DRAFT_252782 [Sphaerobolus stellatus SS14]|uniref:AB hydrolase-1 domain-containing protein n=1 Tax=Sphaerobolus stellatus (strain SS14) TaxID=990650 RepID=A0A0C9VZ97_SPHS4|nr:hypothetical protein M422DRAFT_252782 [Sphaerobolus stellatus SS14]